ncbi:hypothetical protein MCOR27_005609 [Pyricularia oryzae]|uniref:Uncharacterized protein n=1 Tax=Pyricularia grisea TaxID=148305 RepID=A0ABQ8N9A2_PYRGI|nr:hypothetical protein MCOR01_007374 [Pyricularia oryzae]KAI6293373.1 hypothetical protein MCOR33_009200 [Pyricularia grisea]KAH9434026.1 hypothetical protein MCOR02_006054 [Pyricularia oryzae]KAI6260627.1 hypothetical protein MCOR19_003096 [Pyricularia oryzae]KAI6270433.1 hypothetical protein MCOR26_008241 [Pyricularia oryzae]
MSSSHGEGIYKMDKSGAAWLLARQVADDFVRTNRTSLFSNATKSRQNTQMLIQELRFASAKSIRTSTITLAAFNTIAAFATVLGILWESYSRERRTKGYSIRRDGLNFVAGADVYPLFLSLGIMIQGIIFAVAQSSGLENIFTAGCTQIAQSMLPALLLVPIIQLVFALEVTFRGIRSQPFAKRGPWAVRLCLILIGLSTLGAFVVALVAKSPDFCFASLFWFVARYSLGIFVVLLIITIILFGATVTTFMRLSRNSGIDTTERMGASRMVFYLALAVISNALVIPFFQQLAFEDQRSTSFSGLPLTLSMVASVVTEVSGLMTGGLYLFLRSNTLSAIGSKLSEKEDTGRERFKNSIQVRGSDDEQDDSGITSPNGLRRMDSDASIISHYSKDEEAGNMRSNQTYASPMPSNDDFPKPPEPSYATRTSRRFKASSIFSAMRPLSTRSNNAPLLPATTYSPNAPVTNTNSTAVKPHRFDFSALKPPPSMKNLHSRHRRDSSIASHLTVQLGLRLSNVEDIRGQGPGRDSCTAVIMVDQTGEPSRPTQQQGLAPQQPRHMPKPSPLAQAITITADDDDVDEVSLDNTKPTEPTDILLPAKAMVPAISTVESLRKTEATPLETLSPTVYSPAGSSPKMVSPRGVGFTSPPISRFNSQSTQRSASQRSTASKRSDSKRGPPPRKPSTASQSTLPRSGKGNEWI